MSKHTPGLWKTDFKKFAQVKAENGALIAECKPLTTMVNLQANAKLIAAAPELLEALKFMIDRFAPCRDDYIFSKRAAIDKAIAAIEKAEGKA